MLPLCLDQKVGVIPWSPLARGRLARGADQATQRAGADAFADRMYDPTEDADRGIIDAVSAIAQRRSLPNAQVALAWLLQKPGVTSPIVGATKPHHLTDAVAALSVVLTADEIAQLEVPYRPHPVAGVTVGR